MRMYLKNSLDFSADCAHTQGQCVVARENILFLDDGKEHIAIELLQEKCGIVVITPDASNQGQAWLYHTSCDRMTDVVTQIFQDHLQAPTSIHQSDSEMMVGELHRCRIDIAYSDCRARVDGFSF